jgi:hypothetical protein
MLFTFTSCYLIEFFKIHTKNNDPDPGRLSEFFEIPSVSHREKSMTQSHISPESSKVILQGLSKLEAWPTFSGDEEYDHVDFIKTIDTIQEDARIEDIVITSKLKHMFKGIALQWFSSVRTIVGDQSWSFWKDAIHKKCGTPAWRRKLLTNYQKDKFIPGTTPAASWVTRQYKRIMSCEPQTNHESLMFELLTQMDGEVSFAAQNAMKDNQTLTSLINVLEDITEYTSIGKRKSSYIQNNKSYN